MLIYNLVLRFFHACIYLYSFINRKANLFVSGRQQSLKKLVLFQQQRNSEHPLYWFHCASLGEFEQARPLIESLKLSQPKLQIAISFFSPSGYEIQHKYAQADVVFYLPMATPRNSQRVIKLLNPNKIFFIKYEFWLNYINAAYNSKIPVYLVSALFNSKQIFFRWYGTLFFNILKKYKKIFVQDESSQLLLKQHGISSIVSGDTRFDRVLANKEKATSNKLIEDFTEGKKLIVLGSSWPKEEEYMLNNYDSTLNYKIIIAPHDIQRNLLLKGSIPFIKYSEANTDNILGKQLLIIDNIGMLSSLYSYANIAFVGGGFRGSLHNILEAAVFGIPVIYGSETQKHPEGEHLEAAGGGIKIEGDIQLRETIKVLLTDESISKKMGYNAEQFIIRNSGATLKILSEI